MKYFKIQAGTFAAKNSIPAVFCALIAFQSAAGESLRENQIEIFINDAINKNLYIKSRESESRASHHAAKNSSRTYPDPEIMIMKSRGEMNETTLYSQPNYQHSRTNALEYRVTQPVPFPGKLTTEASVKKSDARISELKLSLEKNKTASELLSMLIDLRRLEDQIAVTEDFYNKIIVLSKVASSRYGSGGGSLSTVTSIKLRANEYRDRLILLKGEKTSQKINLDYFNDKEFSFSETDFDLYFKNLRAKIPSENELEKNSLELAVAEEMQKRSKHEKNRSRLSFAPDIGVFAGYRKENMNNEYLMYGERKEEMYSMGITVKVPVWSSFANVSDYKEKKEMKASADLAREDYLKKIQYRYRASSEMLKVYEERMELINKVLIPQAALSMKSSRLAWETNKADFSALLEGYDSLYRENMTALEVRSKIRKETVFLSDLQNVILKNASE